MADKIIGFIVIEVMRHDRCIFVVKCLSIHREMGQWRMLKTSASSPLILCCWQIKSTRQTCKHECCEDENVSLWTTIFEFGGFLHWNGCQPSADFQISDVALECNNKFNKMVSSDQKKYMHHTKLSTPCLNVTRQCWGSLRIRLIVHVSSFLFGTGLFCSYQSATDLSILSPSSSVDTKATIVEHAYNIFRPKMDS